VRRRPPGPRAIGSRSTSGPFADNGTSSASRALRGCGKSNPAAQSSAALPSRRGAKKNVVLDGRPIDRAGPRLPRMVFQVLYAFPGIPGGRGKHSASGSPRAGGLRQGRGRNLRPTLHSPRSGPRGLRRTLPRASCPAACSSAPRGLGRGAPAKRSGAAVLPTRGRSGPRLDNQDPRDDAGAAARTLGGAPETGCFVNPTTSTRRIFLGNRVVVMSGCPRRHQSGGPFEIDPSRHPRRYTRSRPRASCAYKGPLTDRDQRPRAISALGLRDS